MSRILVTGSADGLRRATAQALLGSGHEVVVHARNEDRLAAVGELVDRGAVPVVGDLADLDRIRDVAEQVNRLGRMDAVIHDAGVSTGRTVLPVNVVAPYLSTAPGPAPAAAGVPQQRHAPQRAGRPGRHRLERSFGPRVLLRQQARRFQDRLLDSLARFTGTALA